MQLSRILKGSIIVAFLALALIVFSFLLSLLGSPPLPFGEKIGVVEVKGVIVDSKKINEDLIKMRERDDVRAIVLRIDSPGGGVAPSQEIYEEVRRTRKKKKVVASIGSVAASGGYYIALGADRIVANPGSITGSIGVVVEFANIKELLTRIGIKGYVIKSGEFKDIGSPLREMTPRERDFLQRLVKELHQQFIDVVSENRGIERKKVEALADGRIFTGTQALKLGLIDSLGNFNDAIDLAARLAGIKGKPVIVYPERRRGIWSLLFGEVEALLRRVYMDSQYPAFNYSVQ